DPAALAVLTLGPAEVDRENAGPGPDEVYGNYLNESLPRLALARGRALLRHALTLNPRPTALLCYNEVIAIGVVQAAQKMGLLIPEEIALAATSRSLVAELSPISLTTCDVQPGHIAAA